MTKATITLCIVGTLCALVALPLFILTAQTLQWLINEHPFVAIIIAICTICAICVAQARADRSNVARIFRMEKRDCKKAA